MTLLERRIASIEAMSVVERHAEWRRLTGKPVPPAFGAGLLARAIAHVLQEKGDGGSGKTVARRIDRLAKQPDRKGTAKATATVKPGTWLSRTWHGEVHHVVVLESGFEYRGERYGSLTAIARKITGANWSGPRFFGLPSPRLGKLRVNRDG